MSTKRMLFTVLAASAVLLALVFGSQLAGAKPPAQPPIPAGLTVPYPGRLNDAAGQPAPDGAYDFTFTLYAAETGGEPLWSETQTGVPVQAGAFQALLGSVQPIPPAALTGSDLWLEVAVRGPGEAAFTALAPRQRVSATAPAPDSPSAGLACPHDHWGETWTGSNLDYGNRIVNTSTGAALRVDSQGIGLLAIGGSRSAILASSWGSTRDYATLWVNNTNSNHGMAATLNNNSDYATAHVQNWGSGEVLVLQSKGGRFLRAVDYNWDAKFRMEANGEAYADGDWNDGGADFAEMLPAVTGLEPGDVLAIGPDGTLVRSTEPYQTSVAGVYSTDPGFVAGVPIEGKIPGTIPLAMAGAVPVKVSAENGPIRPGDLLVASATPGHAMRAGPNPPQGTVIGKALEKWDAGTGVIKMLAVLQ